MLIDDGNGDQMPWGEVEGGQGREAPELRRDGGILMVLLLAALLIGLILWM